MTTLRSGLRPYRLSVEQYLAMIRAGVFARDERAELLGGVLVRKATKTPPRDFVVCALGDRLRRLLAEENWTVREEKSATISRWSRPAFDLAILRGPRDRYRRRAATPSDLSVVVDVISPRDGDRSAKWRLCASAGISSFWIVDLPLGRIEVHREPGGEGRSAAYRERTIYDSDADFPVVIGGRELGRIAVKDLLA